MRSPGAVTVRGGAGTHEQVLRLSYPRQQRAVGGEGPVPEQAEREQERYDKDGGCSRGDDQRDMIGTAATVQPRAERGRRKSDDPRLARQHCNAEEDAREGSALCRPSSSHDDGAAGGPTRKMPE